MIESPEGKETVVDGIKVVAALQKCESNAATLTTDHVQLEQRVRQLEELVRSLRQDFNVCTRENKEKTCARANVVRTKRQAPFSRKTVVAPTGRIN